MALRLIRTTTAALLGVLGLLASGAPSEARSLVPIAVDSCALGRSFDGTNSITGVSLVYRNLTRLPAKRVTFDVRYGGITQRVTDVGTFTQEARIEHQLGAFTGTTYDANQPTSCSVHSVTFADGHTYVYDFSPRYVLRIRQS